MQCIHDGILLHPCILDIAILGIFGILGSCHFGVVFLGIMEIVKNTILKICDFVDFVDFMISMLLTCC